MIAVRFASPTSTLVSVSEVESTIDHITAPNQSLRHESKVTRMRFARRLCNLDFAWCRRVSSLDVVQAPYIVLSAGPWSNKLVDDSSATPMQCRCGDLLSNDRYHFIDLFVPACLVESNRDDQYDDVFPSIGKVSESVIGER